MLGELIISSENTGVSEEQIQLIKEEIAALSSAGEITHEEAEKALTKVNATAFAMKKEKVVI